MNKGISTVIATMLIVIITISLAGTGYLFIGGILTGTTAEVFEIVDISNDKVIVRNRGTKPIEEFRVIVDGDEVDYYIRGGSIQPGDVGTIILDIPEGEHEIILGSRTMSLRWKWEAKETLVSYLVGYWKFDEGSGSTVYDSSQNNNDGDIYASGRNQIQNPSFEKGKQDWGSGSGTWDIVMDEKYHAINSSRFQDLTGDAGSEYAGYVYVPVTPGEPITISTYSKGDNIQLGSQPWHKALLIGRWINSTGDVIPGLYPDMQIGDGTGTWNWKRSDTTHTPPADAVEYRFFLGLIGSSIGSLWVDAVQVEYGSTLTDFTDSPWTSGQFGSALEFDGVEDYVRIDSIPQLGPNPDNGPTTITLWFRTSDTTPSENKYLFSDNWQEIGFRLLNSGILRGITYQSVNTLQPITDDWHFTALSYDYDNLLMSFYLDGNLQGSTSVTIGKGFNDVPFTVGVDYQGGSLVGPFNGIIDEVRIYNRSLTQTEIQDIMNLG